ASYELLARLIDPSTRLGRILANVFPVMAPALALAASPDSALVRLERVVSAIREHHELADRLAGDPTLVETLAHATAASSFATDLLNADPRLLVGPTDEGWIEAAGSRLIKEVAGYASRRTPVQELGVGLSGIADHVLRSALADAAPGVPFAVIGLGKLGAE